MARGKVNIVGVNGLGAVTGMHPAVGAAVSAGLGTGLAVGLRQTDRAKHPKLHKYSELIGGGAAVAASAAMMASRNMRAAGFAGLVVALLTNGVRFMGQSMDKTNGLGIVSAQQVPTLGAMAAYNMPTLGAMSAQRVPTLGMVQAESRQLAGPGVQFQGLGANYGATCMG